MVDMLLSLFLLAVDGYEDQSSEINHLSLSPIASEVLSLSALHQWSPSVVSLHLCEQYNQL